MFKMILLIIAVLAGNNFVLAEKKENSRKVAQVVTNNLLLLDGREVGSIVGFGLTEGMPDRGGPNIHIQSSDAIRRCQLNKEIVEKRGISLGEMMLLLASKNVRVNCLMGPNPPRAYDVVVTSGEI